MTLTDVASRCGYVFLLKNTDRKLLKFRHEVNKQIGYSIIPPRLDRNGNYLSSKFHTYMKEYGILSYEDSSRDTSVRRCVRTKNQILLDMIRFITSRSELLFPSKDMH